MLRVAFRMMSEDWYVYQLLKLLLGVALVWAFRDELKALWGRVWKRKTAVEQGLTGWRARVEDARAWCLVVGWGALLACLLGIAVFTLGLRANGLLTVVLSLGAFSLGSLLLGLVLSGVAGWMDA